MSSYEMEDTATGLISKEAERKARAAEKQRQAILQAFLDTMLEYLAYSEIAGEYRDIDSLLDFAHASGKEMRDDLGQRFRESGFTRPLIGGRFRFVSRGLRDYYAVRYLVDQEVCIFELLSDERWQDPLANSMGLLTSISRVENIISSLLEEGKFQLAVRCFANRSVAVDGRLKNRIMNLTRDSIRRKRYQDPSHELIRQLLGDEDPDVRIEAIRILPIADQQDLKMLIQRAKPSLEYIYSVRREAIVAIAEAAIGRPNLSEAIVEVFKELLDLGSEDHEFFPENRAKILEQLKRVDVQQARDIAQDIIDKAAEQQILEEYEIVLETARDIIKFDVFLAHNSRDKATVESICEELKKRGIKPWFDKEQIPPGSLFQDRIQQGIASSRSAAIFVGPGKLGNWQAMELRTSLSMSVEAELPVIPLLLPGVDHLPSEVPFLKEYSRVCFTKVNDSKALDNLMWGITGEHPQGRKRT